MRHASWVSKECSDFCAGFLCCMQTCLGWDAQKAQRDERYLTPGRAARLHAFPWVLVARGSHCSMQQVGRGCLQVLAGGMDVLPHHSLPGLDCSSANKCLLKVAAYAAQLEQYQKAIEIYEQVRQGPVLLCLQAPPPGLAPGWLLGCLGGPQLQKSEDGMGFPLWFLSKKAVWLPHNYLHRLWQLSQPLSADA